jgi:uncharacterized protein GlcG (DUF336 family)
VVNARWLASEHDRVRIVALLATVLGWSLMWARALSLITVIPLWLPIAAFLFGLALIPLREADLLRVMPRSRMLLRSLTAVLHLLLFVAFASTVLSAAARAQTCPVSHDQLTNALKQSVKPTGGPGNGGFDNNEWAVVVTRQGTICAVTFSGSKPTDQWLASRAIAAEKANTANAMSVDKMAISTANLYGGSLPGAPLYGLITTNPAVASLITAGDPNSFGSAQDPLVGKNLNGGVVFGGGLALYDGNAIVGALGVSGDTSCADHNVAWRVRHALGLDHVPNGLGPDHNDEIIYDMLPDKTSASGFGHPQCGGSEAQVAAQLHSGVVPQWAQVMKQ